MSFHSGVSSKLPIVGSPSSGDYATMAAVLVAAMVSQPGFGGRHLNMLNFTGLRGPMGEVLENGVRIGIRGVRYSTTIAHAILAVVVFFVAQWGLGKVFSGGVRVPISEAASAASAAAMAPVQAAAAAGQAVSDAIGDATSVDAMRRRRLAAARARAAAVSAQRRHKGALRGQKTGGSGGFLARR